MDSQLISVIGNDKRIISMINYIFYKGITTSNYTDFVIYDAKVPEFIEKRILYTDTTMNDIFFKLFCIDEKLFNVNDWYDFQNHKCIKSKEININNSRIYNEELYNLYDFQRKLAFPTNNPIIKISELRKLFNRVINESFGDTYLYNIIKTANDISISNELCIIVGFTNNYELTNFKRTFKFNGNIIDITGNSDLNKDYTINKEFLLKDSIGRFKQELKLFYNIKEIIKFILL